jgi:hypothetical protein
MGVRGLVGGALVLVIAAFSGSATAQECQNWQQAQKVNTRIIPTTNELPTLYEALLEPCRRNK